MKNTVYQDSSQLTLTAPTGGVVGGTPVVIGSFFGFPIADAAEGARFALTRTGVFEVSKTTGQTWAEGEKIYFNSSNGRFTKTSASGLYAVGAVYADAGSADDVGQVAIDAVAVVAVP